jgi:hypothetical protein
MSEHHHHDLFAQRQNFFIKASNSVRGGVVFCIVIGLVALVAAVASGQWNRIWGAFLFNLFFFFALALGGSAFSAMQDIIGAKWGRPVMRLHESFSSFLPVAGGLFLVFFALIKFRLFHAHEVYSWIVDPSIIHHFFGKRTWLQENPMLIRDALAVIGICGLAHWQIGLKTKRDAAFVEGHKDKAVLLGKEAKDKLRYWSAPLLVSYAILFSLLVFDIMMSLAPTWFSTLFAGWFFAIMMQTLMATLMIMMWVLKDSTIGEFFGKQQFHDVGKLMHGFTVFFAYLTYAHVLTYWYGNVPEETQYFLVRLEKPWIYMVFAIPLLAFVLPLYALIPKASKWTKTIAMPLALIILFAQWHTYMLVVQPEVVKSGAVGFVPWIEAGIFFGVLGLFLMAVLRFAARNPMIPVADPLFKEAIEEAHH